MSTPFCRNNLSAEGLLRDARRVFGKIPDQPSNDMARVDHLIGKTPRQTSGRGAIIGGEG